MTVKKCLRNALMVHKMHHMLGLSVSLSGMIENTMLNFRFNGRLHRAVLTN